VGTEWKRTCNAHHVTFDKIKPEWHLLDTLVYAVDTFFGIREDNVGFLVIACQYALAPAKKKSVSRGKSMGIESYATTIARPSWRTRSTRPSFDECVELSSGIKRRGLTVDVALETGHRIDVSERNRYESRTRRGRKRAVPGVPRYIKSTDLTLTAIR